jgi:hypothetical protein
MSIDKDSWDPSDFRVVQGGAASPKAIVPKRPAAAVGRAFIAGPVDLAWLSQARTLGVTALWVGLLLWHLKGLKRADRFIVSNLFTQKWGVLPDAKARALRALERAGLISVQRSDRRSPLVTLIVSGAKSEGLGA